LDRVGEEAAESRSLAALGMTIGGPVRISGRKLDVDFYGGESEFAAVYGGFQGVDDYDVEFCAGQGFDFAQSEV
jgi:hypothetical protein